MRIWPVIVVFGLCVACAETPVTAADEDAIDSGASEDAGTDASSVAEDTAPASDIWPDGFWVPSHIDQLYGIWVSDDGTTVRAFELAQFDLFDVDMKDVSPAYRIWRYNHGETKAVVERGRVTLALGPILKLDTVWSEVVTDKGKKTDLTLLPAPADTFAIATGSGTPRVFSRAGFLP